MSKKKTFLIVGLVVVVLTVIAFVIKSINVPKVSFTDNGGIAFSDNIDTTIKRSKVLKLSMEIEKYIKETYGYSVKVKEIKLNGSNGSAIAAMGESPAVIGSSVTVNFEENEYIDYMSKKQMFSLEPDDMPRMYVKLKND